MSNKERPSLYEMVSELKTELYNTPLDWMKNAPPNMKASFLGSPCLRKIYYNYLRVEQDYGWEWDKIENFEVGEALHGMVQRWLYEISAVDPDSFQYVPFLDPKTRKIKKSWKNEWGMKPPDPEFPVNDVELSVKNNKIDGVIIFDRKDLWLVEAKSINEKGWNRYIKESAKDEHIVQGNFYAYLFEQNLNAGEFSHIPELENIEEVKGTLYVYIHREKDNVPWKEFWIEKDPEVFEETVTKIIQVKEFVEERILPPKTEDFCNWCGHRDKCKKDFKPKS